MLNLQPGDIFADHYKLVRLIDTGGFADVWEAIFLSAGNVVALKIYPRLDQEGVKNMEDEYRNQADLSHTHLLIARYFGKHNGYPFLEMKYCSEGNASSKTGSCSEEDIAKCMYHVGSALAYLHENNIVHQDIKPNNFLIDRQGNFYLADLGLSLSVRNTIKKFTQSKSTSNSYVSGLTPPQYRAPELYERNKESQPIKATDIWAFGASLYELCTGDEPFGEFGGLTQFKTPESPTLPQGYSVQLDRIIKKCLSKETWDRPKAHEIAEWGHNFLLKGDFGYIEPNPSQKKEDNDKHQNQKTNADIIIPPKKSKLPLLIGSVLVIAIIIGVVFWKNNAASGNDSNSTGNIAKKDSVTEVKTKDTASKGIIANNPSNQAAKTDTAKKQQEIINDKPVVREPEIIVTDGPYVEEPPKSGLIKISRIERTPDNLKIYFTLRKEGSDNRSYTFDIYGPEQKSNCFYIEADGENYSLLSISPKGKGLTFGASNTYRFTATFRKIPKNVSVINVVEGEDRDRMNQNYWTFKRVHIN